MHSNIEWIEQVKNKLSNFLESMKGKKDGYYRYAYKGDLYNESIHWGLGQSVFAAKLYCMLNDKNLLENNKDSLAKYILRFQRRNGEIFDPFIQRKNLFMRMYKAFLKRELGNLFNQQTRRAETRQAYAVLENLGCQSPLPFKEIKFTQSFFSNYIEKLNWHLPWGAGSHFSHLLFFLYHQKKFFGMAEDKYDQLLNFSLKKLSHYSRDDGFWYEENDPGILQKINGAMKVCTGLNVANRTHEILNPEKLIDGCLKFSEGSGGCNNFNVIYVLKCCTKLTDHKIKLIKDFALNQLKLYREYYWPEYGGFTFYKDKSETHYYGARVTKGYPFPDMHGTVMFFWGIVLISEILGIREELGLKEVVN